MAFGTYYKAINPEQSDLMIFCTLFFLNIISISGYIFLGLGLIVLATKRENLETKSKELKDGDFVSGTSNFNIEASSGDIIDTCYKCGHLIKINKESASLAMLIEDQLQMIKGYAEEKNVEVTGQKPIVYDQVYVDKDMIQEVIVNLLSNAVKYTPSGGSVKIETEVDESAALVRVSVTDTGVGIPEEDIGHVFDKFYRVGANKKQAKGTGLGLNLVKQIIEKVHDGRVFVMSKVGVGSTFSFELPLATRQTV